MNKIFLSFIICFSMSCVVFSQDKNFIKHTVLDGETVYGIGQKYKVTTNDIYNLNPDAKTGIHPDLVLIIPIKTQKPVAKTTNLGTNKHEVLPKETLYGIAKLYEISVGDLKKVNPILETEPLKIGQIILIPSSKNISNSNSVTNNSSIHVTEKPIEKNILTTDYVVQAKETLYGLSKKFNLKLEELIELNPQLENGVQEAMTIKVPSNATNISNSVHTNTTVLTSPNIVDSAPKMASLDPYIKRNFTDLTKSISKSDRKKLVMLLPFNVSRIKNDTVTSSQERLKKDKFLNMALDFYSGALMAIDSAKTIGLNIDIKILDSEETKTTSNIDNLFTENDFQSANAIIGPFYQSQVDKLAGLLENNNVPIISPLSKETGKPNKNSYISMPSGDMVKAAMFDYMREKNGNIIAAIDIKKAALKQYITDNQPDTKFVEVSEKGLLSTDNLKTFLVKDKMNFVVFASERTGTIFAITNVLLNSLANYQIKLVILEPNPTFDFEEIGLSRLTKLKLTYPSLNRENETVKGLIFDKEFKKKNKIFPNQYATRGFDLTFDTLLRLSQNKTFEETVKDIATEQVENKFDYSPKPAGGFDNRGVYILQYNNDLTISEAE